MKQPIRNASINTTINSEREHTTTIPQCQPGHELKPLIAPNADGLFKDMPTVPQTEDLPENPVDMASMDSFPASDPPAWIGC